VTATATLHDGAAVEVEVHGLGPAVLAFGLPVVSASPPEDVRLTEAINAAFVDRLAGRYSVVLFNYPGQPPKPDTLTPDTVASDLLAIADAAGVDRFAWVGYSWTAVIGLQLALRTDRVSALVLGGWPPVDAPYGPILRVIESFGDETVLSQPEVRQQRNFYRGLQSFDDREAQRRLDCPRLCFTGTADDIFGLGIAATIMETQGELEALGWDVRLLEGLDHAGALQPEVFVPVVADWLEERLP
jgi:pimeloyl-ACP methyl ester carboxylesterase